MPPPRLEEGDVPNMWGEEPRAYIADGGEWGERPGLGPRREAGASADGEIRGDLRGEEASVPRVWVEGEDGGGDVLPATGRWSWQRKVKVPSAFWEGGSRTLPAPVFIAVTGNGCFALAYGGGCQL
tara:strand:- start:700 stop:1077 length:378 start_codon:yes stop_codon:yes gene_type:complete